MRVRLLWVSLMFVLMASVAACGSGGGSPEVDTDSDLHRVFELMPDNEHSQQYFQVVWNKRVGEYIGVPVPPADAPPDALAEWRENLPGPFIERLWGVSNVPWWTDAEVLSGLHRAGPLGSETNTRALGFDLRDIEAVAQYGILSEPFQQAQTELVLGDMSTEVAASSMQACGECPPQGTVSYGGVNYYIWNEGYKQSLDKRFSPPAFDHLGRGGAVRIGDGYAVRTLLAERMEESIDAQTGAVPSLLDNPDWQLAADAVSEYEFLMVTGSTRNVDQADAPELAVMRNRELDEMPPNWREWFEAYPERAETVTSSSPMLPYHSAALTGVIGTDEGVEVVVALAFEDDETAQQAAGALAGRVESGLRDAQLDGLLPWSELVAESEFDADGRVVIGRIRPVPPVPAEKWHFNYPLFLIIPSPGALNLGGTEPHVGPTAEFLMH